MNKDLALLTEKEKEALRLLLGGHDAKSSAAELDISVHTVNDRLRNARRKLSVSSSREAARILGDAEGTTPQIPVHNELGSAQAEPKEDDDSTAEEKIAETPANTKRRTGVPLMIFATTIAAGAAVLAWTSTQTPEQEPSPTATATATETVAPQFPEPSGEAPPRAAEPASRNISQSFQPSAPIANAESEGAAREWLGLVANGDPLVSRQRAAPVIRERHSVDMWELGIMLTRNNYGTVLERTLRQVERRQPVTGSGADAVEVLLFETDFAQSRGAIEELIMHRIDGEWLVADYDLEEAESCDD